MSLTKVVPIYALAILLGLAAVVQGLVATSGFIDTSQIGASRESEEQATPTTWKRIITVLAGLASIVYGVHGIIVK